MAELKTKPGGDVMAFLESIKEEEKKKDCMALLKLMKQITKEEPTLWGGRIVGFGKYHYKSERSKQEGDWFVTGFSSNKQNLTVYIIAGFEKYEALMKKLGKHKTGVSCLYINKLSDVDEKVLKELITSSYQYMKEKHK
jgi:Domain of unknown function (DU1801)